MPAIAIDELVKSRNLIFWVIPANPGALLALALESFQINMLTTSASAGVAVLNTY
jgi:hypothetical protein